MHIGGHYSITSTTGLLHLGLHRGSQLTHVGSPVACGQVSSQVTVLVVIASKVNSGILCVCSLLFGWLTTYGKALEDTVVATAACSPVSGTHMQGVSTGPSPAAWNVFQAATKYACLL